MEYFFRLKNTFVFMYLIYCFNVSATVNGTHSTITKRIVGGTAAKNGEFPYIMSIFHLKRYRGAFSMITTQTAIGAAHMLYGNAVEDLEGRICDVNKFNGKLVYFDRKVLHPDFQRTNINDIGLLILNHSICDLCDINPIALPARRRSFVRGYAKMVGWGWIGPNRRDKTINLIVADVRLIDPRPYKYFFNITLTGKEILTKTPGIRAMPGDSGSPLIYTDDCGNQLLIGVMSGGVHDDEEAPDIFASTSAYYHFIKENSVGEPIFLDE
ncbi:chymotrypsin-2-like [Centruroides sculpturatus]|uniref:chymotrypsin-2-like n=1 Tax=Centruroides sculpturatus TaxID=218467 RepID=UPI000C6E3E0F|nr:chymotrypsin-2-like [Centruroides sculpturatus]